MSNFFNDLNKMVNTINKVDKLLTEKPKRETTKYITKRFTQKEIDFLVSHLGGLKNFELHPDDIPTCRKIYNKLKK